MTPDPVLIATEGALWGSVKPTASCLTPSWSAMMPANSRSAATPCVGSMPNAWSTSYDTFTDRQRARSTRARALIWWFYRDLKAYCRDPDTTAQNRFARPLRPHLQTQNGLRYARWAARRRHRRKHELLRVLDRPDIPLNTNAAENDIRG